MESLVIWIVVDSIEFAFLPAGHYIDDIELDSSITSSYVQSKDAVTLADSHNSSRKAFDGSAPVAFLKWYNKLSSSCNGKNVLHIVRQFLQYWYFSTA